jgi:hypothetical protein
VRHTPTNRAPSHGGVILRQASRGMLKMPCLHFLLPAGRNLTVEVHGISEGNSNCVAIKVLGLQPGLAEIEVQRGSFLSLPTPLLVLPEATQQAEVAQLQSTGGPDATTCPIQNIYIFFGALFT